jgi:hypothetical protein
MPFPPGFVTDDELKQRIADMMKVPIGALPRSWDTIIVDANRAAYMDIRGALILREFAATQVDGWDRGAEFQKDLGLYWALVKGAGLHSYDDRYISRLDRRKDLETVLVEFVGGAVQDPSDAQGGQAGIDWGRMDESEDRWNSDAVL